MTFFVSGDSPALRVGSTRLARTRVHHLLVRIDHDLEEVRTTDGVKTGHVRTLNSCEVFAAHRERHMAGDAVDLAVGVGIRNHLSLCRMAVSAVLTNCGTCYSGSPVVAGNLMRVVAGNAAHALFIVLRHEELSAFCTAGRARRLRLSVECLFKLTLSIGTINFVFDEVQALMAAVAVCAHVVGVANQVSAFSMAFFTSDTAGDCVFLEFFRVAQSSEEFLLILKVKLEGVTDFAVRGSSLEQKFAFISRTVGCHTPLVRGGRSELAEFCREVRDQFLNFFRFFRCQPFCPAAGELVAAGNNLTGAVFEQAVTNVVGTANEPSVDVAVFGTRCTDGGVNHVSRNTVRKNRGLRTVQFLLQVVIDFRMFARETNRLGMTGTLPLFVLNRVAFAAFFRSHKLVGEVKNGALAQTVLRGHRTVAVLMSGVLLSIAFTKVFRAAGRDNRCTDHSSVFSVSSKDGMILE